MFAEPVIKPPAHSLEYESGEFQLRPNIRDSRYIQYHMKG